MSKDKNLVKAENVNITGVNVDIDKATIKLLNIAKDIVGSFTDPNRVKELADARAYKKLKQAETNQQIALLQADTEFELQKRAVERLKYQETVRQINIESTILKSAERLEGKEVSDEPVSEDWKNRFFDSVKDVSNEELQNLWARILATEITTPNTISLRTLEVLKNITAKEANLFGQALRLSSLNKDGIIILNELHFDLERFHHLEAYYY